MKSKVELIPAAEAANIQSIVQSTLAQLRLRYSGDKPVLRGVHPKSHGCVMATFEVLPSLATEYRVGVFATPGRKYEAVVRFSNAAPLVTPDSPNSKHGSRGMAIKLKGVDGPQLGMQIGQEPVLRRIAAPPGEPLPLHGNGTQDFLMVNQPVFAFANVEDYEVLSRVLVDNHDVADAFFAERMGPAATAEARKSATETRGIVVNIQSSTSPPAFQKPPASPVDNDYFGAAPFRFGPDRVMRFRVTIGNHSIGKPDITRPNYLREALTFRLRDSAQGPVVFHFQAQIRDATGIDPEKDIENASHRWEDEQTYPYIPLATLTIPLQEFNNPEQIAACEKLVFSPWHGLEDHEPLGGINRLRRAVYEASSMFRNLPKEPGPI